MQTETGREQTAARKKEMAVLRDRRVTVTERRRPGEKEVQPTSCSGGDEGNEAELIGPTRSEEGGLLLQRQVHDDEAVGT